jgi:hypothetical protein
MGKAKQFFYLKLGFIVS